MSDRGNDPPAERPFGIDPGLYPFRSRWHGPPGRRIHYVDEGRGVPVLLLHGNPTWSFLYREIVTDLAGECRCVAPDYPGFGMSDHPPGYTYRPEAHSAAIGSLVRALGIEEAVLVLQDWGGPIGLSLALEGGLRPAGLVLANTWCWAPDLPMRLFSALMGGRPFGRWLQRRRNFFARRIVPIGIHRAERRSPDVLDAYRKPFPTPASREGTWVFPRAIRGAASWLSGLESWLERLPDVPVELVWGVRDPALGREAVLDRWRRRFPGAGVDRVRDAAHYIQEDRPERIAAAVRRVRDRRS